MAVLSRKAHGVLNFGPDYHKIRDFLLRLGSPNYLFGRWDWMITHSHLDSSGLEQIGIWEDQGAVVALCTYDCNLGNGYFGVLPEYGYLKKELLEYSQDNLAKDGNYRALIGDNDGDFQDVASELGFIPTTKREYDSIFHLEKSSLDYTLPAGYRLLSLSEDYDPYKYGRILWNGFDHEKNGEGFYSYTKGESAQIHMSLKRPNVNLDIKIAVANPNGDWVSFCGMWQDPRSEYALVEPVATQPEYRKLGLGKAAVLEGMRRCRNLGAKKVLVGSCHQFYYNIGFRPFRISTWWINKNKMKPNI